MKFFLVLLFLGLVSAAPITTIIERDLNAFLSKIVLLFPFSGAITSISGVLTAAEATLATLTGTATTADDLSGDCKAVTVIFARGTTEPGNVGVLAGPPFFNALRSAVGSSNVAIQGVAYPASIEGFLVGGDVAGSATMYVSNKNGVD
jgi:cutinase